MRFVIVLINGHDIVKLQVRVFFVFITEGQYHIRYNPHLSVGWPMVVAGLIIPLLLGRSAKDRLYSYLALIPTSLLGVAAYEGLTWFDWLRANFF